MGSRAKAVGKAFAAAGLGEGETLAIATGDGREVHIDNIVIKGDRVEVILNGTPEGGDPAFVIVNPPTLIPDPLGDVVAHGMTFREDPLGAIAQVIADNGGAAQKARMRGRVGR